MLLLNVVVAAPNERLGNCDGRLRRVRGEVFGEREGSGEDFFTLGQDGVVQPRDQGRVRGDRRSGDEEREGARVPKEFGQEVR